MNKLQFFLIATILVGVLSTASVTAEANQNLYQTISAQNFNNLQNDEVNELLKTAVELYRQKKFDEALALCLKAAELSPNDFRPHSISGFIYSAQWKLKSASEAFAKAISLKPDNKQLYLQKAKTDELRNEKEEAISTARKALELDPAFGEAYEVIGDALRYNDKRVDEAIAAYRSAIKVNPRVLSAYESLGDTLQFNKKDEKGAEEIYKNAMETDSKGMAGRFPLGRLLVKQGRLKEARAVWEGRTSDVDRTFPNFITLLEQAEKLKKATDTLAAKPDNPDALLEMGNAVMEGASWVVDGRQERALEYFKKALKLKPTFAAAQFAICKAYIQIADTDKAKNKNVDEELAKLKALDPKLAKEMEDYRKTYSGGLKASPTNFNQ